MGPRSARTCGRAAGAASALPSAGRNGSSSGARGAADCATRRTVSYMDLCTTSLGTYGASYGAYVQTTCLCRAPVRHQAVTDAHGGLNGGRCTDHGPRCTDHAPRRCRWAGGRFTTMYDRTIARAILESRRTVGPIRQPGAYPPRQSSTRVYSLRRRRLVPFLIAGDGRVWAHLSAAVPIWARRAARPSIS